MTPHCVWGAGREGRLGTVPQCGSDGKFAGLTSTTEGMAKKEECFPKEVASAMFSTGSGLPRVSFSICTAASSNCTTIGRFPSATAASSEPTRVAGTTWAGRGGLPLTSYMQLARDQMAQVQCSTERTEGGCTSCVCVCVCIRK